MRRWILLLTVTFAAAILQIAVTQSQFGSSYQLLLAVLNHQLDFSNSFEWTAFLHATLPRWVMGLAVGGSLGLVGSLFQQLTQNRMMSPLTLGTSSGAWLGLVILSVMAPQLVGVYPALFAMTGALVAMGLVIAIVDIRNLSGLPIVLAGMAVNLLLGAFATAIILLHNEYAQNLFIWGAGDLSQNGWDWVTWLLPKLALIILLPVFAPRLLTLMSIGSSGAQARGLNVGGAFLGLSLIGVWLVSVSITSVGVISFVGLIAPNIARHIGFSKSRSELIASFILGSTLLMLTDTLAIFLSFWSLDIIPTGTATAVIGAPALIMLARKKMSAQDNMSLTFPKGRDKLRPKITLFSLLTAFVVVIAISTFVQPEIKSFIWQIPNAFSWSIKWPRMLTAVSAGAGLAVAGVILQRLVYNPLASPDILGVSAGAVLALVLANLIFGSSIHTLGPWVALLGSLVALGVLLVLGRKHNFAPSILILYGIALTAMIEALVQFSLTRVGQEKFVLLQWLAGSTYRVTPNAAITLFLLVTGLVIAALLLSRWMTLIGTGRQFAFGRGLNVSWAYIVLLLIVALLCAFITTTMGPVAFVGLIAPHIAVILGARQAKVQLWVAGLLGGLLLLSADVIGQLLVHPAQIAAGVLVSVIGGVYFVFLLIRERH
ncbi:Fe(3+)-hydroxamate ABC transporter permease FhuB [Photobacterium phosphoreum]|jgi:iron complex transport system permease protein|uniref:Fe(3+)-hydroxamate ABC transporter permease FhuB n=1 Tax=Photobacterium phosphoreum TaxID=659 RepID=A0AAW4ZSM4_PHOPO|nr:Fe(3+)-hydroxamate ABC transporter permease FhuB [Photobacterium phosphoreum]MCD9470302.1 Fe3+-hydroxamate ABC transporter permease FhuB [Photobacterium phosphoreum]MCD9481737.1 Fe(3+)-hydroxamate ABC transporter permease FhuB [Photobacterium phosphoreum]MCD9491460.1 Fe(3+)-hydroxamate ABC transporter permease FhuB [Photobacterium phosphoreum]MCF2190704.1 Fe(3+)-hydroxamate ABC transporter permease FhuB [Photobacterium phosphoreum]MCF2302369.1 Fe(3+)-hydroxamate ABC transporter permease Fhu